MKILIVSILVSGLAFFNALFSNSGRPKTKYNGAPDTGFAVVELFTSEGCSSCPAADALIAKIQK